MVLDAKNNPAPNEPLDKDDLARLPNDLAATKLTADRASPSQQRPSDRLQKPSLFQPLQWPSLAADFCIRFYQAAISPMFPARCRYRPTCSQYARQAIQKYGLIVGGFKATLRILRCHPCSKGGDDPLN